MQTYREITIRPLDDGDREALTRLAHLDSARVPRAPLLGALGDGRLLAARSLATGESIADPWRRTAGASALLEQRASHLNGGRRRWWQRRSRAALPGSPPGAGGRLLDLQLGSR